MVDVNRRGGLIELQINGNVYDLVGAFEINYGAPKRDSLVGPDKVHGYKELPQVPHIKGEIRDAQALDVINEILNATDATLTLTLANGKKAMLSEAWYADEGNIGTEEANIPILFEGKRADEVPA